MILSGRTLLLLLEAHAIDSHLLVQQLLLQAIILHPKVIIFSLILVQRGVDLLKVSNFALECSNIGLEANVGA